MNSRPSIAELVPSRIVQLLPASDWYAAYFETLYEPEEPDHEPVVGFEPLVAWALVETVEPDADGERARWVEGIARWEPAELVLAEEPDSGFAGYFTSSETHDEETLAKLRRQHAARVKLEGARRAKQAAKAL